MVSKDCPNKTGGCRQLRNSGSPKPAALFSLNLKAHQTRKYFGPHPDFPFRSTTDKKKEEATSNPWWGPHFVSV